jgi:hypothetical protein
LFIPFPFYLTKPQYDIASYIFGRGYSITDLIFGRLIGFISSTIFGRTLPDNSIYSDSTSMYILVLLLVILSLLTALLLPRLHKWQLYRTKLLGFIYTFCIYYLALQLLKYGVDKIFKNQFYLPEPNILYTPVGRLDKDILYWSSMGTSHFYSVFMGVLETMAAVFLFFRKTRLIGLLMSLAIMLNVVAVNFGFDIGVKIFSLFLLFLTLYLLTPYTRRLYQVLTQQPVTENIIATPVKRTFLRSFLKWFVIGLILLEAFYPFLRVMVFNRDLAPRPYLHGAYRVDQMIRGDDTLAVASFPIKRLFVHSDGYMIFQDQQDNMQDYKFSYDHHLYQYVLTDYQLHKTPLSLGYNEKDSILTMKYTKSGQLTQIKAKAIDWRKLPVLKRGFHWTTD